jgi:hypothetical protein
MKSSPRWRDMLSTQETPAPKVRASLRVLKVRGIGLRGCPIEVGARHHEDGYGTTGRVRRIPHGYVKRNYPITPHGSSGIEQNT